MDRANLEYEVRLKPAGADDVLEDIVGLVSGRFSGLSGIVYCFSKKEAEQVAGALKDGGVNADFYHADMEFTGTTGRMQVYEDWIRGRIQVVVATIAFGMGINKEDVRFVIHHTLSKGPSAYYQVNDPLPKARTTLLCSLLQARTMLLVTRNPASLQVNGAFSRTKNRLVDAKCLFLILKDGSNGSLSRRRAAAQGGMASLPRAYCTTSRLTL